METQKHLVEREEQEKHEELLGELSQVADEKQCQHQQQVGCGDAMRCQAVVPSYAAPLVA